MDRGRRVDATGGRLGAVRVRASNWVSRRRAGAHRSCDGEATALRHGALVMSTAAEVLLGARRQGELLALMKSDYQDTGAEGRCRRVRF